MPAAGQFNTLIDILKATDTEQASGEETTEYKPYHRRWPAHREDVSGGSTRRGLQVEETVRTVFTIPYNPEDIKTHWRVQVIEDRKEPEILEIVTILRSDKRDSIQIHCSSIQE